MKQTQTKPKKSPKKHESVELKPPVPPPRGVSRTRTPSAAPNPSSGKGKAETRRHSRRKSVNGQRESYQDLQRRKSRAHSTRSHLHHEEKQQSQNKRILLLLILLLFLGAIAALLYYLWPMLFGDNECSSLDLPPEYKAIVCSRLKSGRRCDFNVEVCEIDCPLGLETDEFACIISCDCATEGLFESDVAYDQNNMQTLLSAYMTIEDHNIQLFSGSASNVLNIWNKIKVGTSIRVPYVMSADLDPAVVVGINSAIAALSNETCVELVLRTIEPDYLVFKNGFGCSSSVSRVGGEQHIILSSGCSSLGAVMHEIMHALGFWHEHSRPDRDEHVMVMWKNIDKSNQHHFNTRSIETVFDFGSPYDKASVMHGSGYSFSVDLSSPSMIDLNTDEPVKIQRERLSLEDTAEINALYECFISHDPVANAHWGEWSELGQCSMTCGPGVAYKLRECLNDEEEIVPRRHCGTEYHQEEACEAGPCEQGVWGPWSPCDYTCGLGTRKRTSCCGRNTTTEIENCNMAECTNPAEAFWADWQEWGECLRTCGNGMRRRYRACFDMFDTTIENLRCPQVGTQHLGVEICSSISCPDTEPEVGNWGEWSGWGDCSRTCGIGSHKRDRECYTRNGTIARYCVGENIEIEPCNMTVCPVSILSLWTPWGPWSDCTASCDGGTRNRIRICQSAAPLTLENDCGESMELLDQEKRIETCHNEPCEPEVAQWSDWESWGECSKECEGTQWRLRVCVGGKLGDPQCPWDGIYDTQNCNEGPCDIAGRSMDPSYTGSRWGPWFQWSECSATCDRGWRQRYRLCETADRVMSYDCLTRFNRSTGHLKDKRRCNTDVVCLNPNATWAEWEPWSACTVTCGRGLQKRQRECILGNHCEGSHLDSNVCVMASCKTMENKTEKAARKGIFASGKLSRFFSGGRSGKKSGRGMFQSKPWSRKGSYCEKGSRLFVGDFNGDGKSDKLCLDLKGKITMSYGSKGGEYAGTDWEKETGFCSKVIGLVYAVDFNGDGADDLLCYEKETGKYSVIFSKNGKFDGTGGEIEGKAPKDFCTSHSETLYVSDVDADGRGDLICRDANGERVLFNEQNNNSTHN